jgi:hypothetical protein
VLDDAVVDLDRASGSDEPFDHCDSTVKWRAG